MSYRKQKPISIGVDAQDWKFYNKGFPKFSFSKFMYDKLKANEIRTNPHLNINYLKELNTLEDRASTKNALEKPISNLKNKSIAIKHKSETAFKTEVSQHQRSNFLFNSGSSLNSQILHMNNYRSDSNAEFVLPYISNMNNIRGRYIKLVTKESFSEVLPVIKPILKMKLVGSYQKGIKSKNFKENIKYESMRRRDAPATYRDIVAADLNEDDNAGSYKGTDVIHQLCRSIKDILGDPKLQEINN